MRLVQYLDDEGLCAVAADVGDGHRRVADAGSTYALAWDAIVAGRGLRELVAERSDPERVDLDDLERDGRLLPPLDHPIDPAHMLVTGTGLSHLGSAEGRDKMHKDLAEAAHAHRQHAHVQARARGRQAGGGAGGRAAGVVLQGRRQHRGRTRQAARKARPSRSTAARSPRSSAST